MASRLSQKQVEHEFYQSCRDAGVPTTSPHNKKTGKYKHGFFTIGYAYGGMRIEWVYRCGGIQDISPRLGAREMDLWLTNFDPKSAWKYWKKRDIDWCKSMEARKKALAGRTG